MGLQGLLTHAHTRPHAHAPGWWMCAEYFGAERADNQYIRVVRTVQAEGKVWCGARLLLRLNCGGGGEMLADLEA